VIALDENLGFSAGNNVGIRRALAAGADHVLVLNNDTVVERGAVRELVRAAETLPDVGAVCPYLLFAHDPELLWYAGATYDARRAYPGRVTGYRQRLRPEEGEPRETARGTGAAMLVPRAALERAGLLDERYFFLYEDVEWSLRMRRAGLRTYVAPRAHVLHKVAATQGGEHSVSSAYYGARNQLLLGSEHAPLSGLAAMRRELGTVLVHLARSRRSPQRLASARSVGEGWLDYRRGRFGRRITRVAA